METDIGNPFEYNPTIEQDNINEDQQQREVPEEDEEAEEEEESVLFPYLRFS